MLRSDNAGEYLSIETQNLQRSDNADKYEYRNTKLSKRNRNTTPIE